MSLNFGIAMAHLLNRRRQTIMSLLGAALGVAFFLAVSSLMRGSEKDFIDRLINSAPHITVSDELRQAPPQPAGKIYPAGAIEILNRKPETDIRGIRGYLQIMDRIERTPGLRIAPVLTGQVILNFAGKDHAITMSGVIPERMFGVSDIEQKIVAGSLRTLNENANGIVIGVALAQKFGVDMGDNLTVSAPNGIVRVMKIVGLFSTGSTSVDEGQGYVLLKRAQSLLARPNRVNKLIIQMDDPYAARGEAAQIESRIGYRSESWQEANESITNVLFIRNMIMYSVVSAILIVASFGIYNVISTIVLEKRRDIAIMKAMGFSYRDIRRIFLFEGAVVGLLGSVIGTAFGLVLMKGLERVELVPPGTNKIVNLPIYWGSEQILLACCFALLSAVGAAYFPARKAAATLPVDILRGQI